MSFQRYLEPRMIWLNIFRDIVAQAGTQILLFFDFGRKTRSNVKIFITGWLEISAFVRVLRQKPSNFWSETIADFGVCSCFATETVRFFIKIDSRFQRLFVLCDRNHLFFGQKRHQISAFVRVLRQKPSDFWSKTTANFGVCSSFATETIQLLVKPKPNSGDQKRQQILTFVRVLRQKPYDF